MSQIYQNQLMMYRGEVGTRPRQFFAVALNAPVATALLSNKTGCEKMNSVSMRRLRLLLISYVVWTSRFGHARTRGIIKWCRWRTTAALWTNHDNKGREHQYLLCTPGLGCR